MEEWRTIEEAPNYEISSDKLVRNKKSGRILRPQRGEVQLMSRGARLGRSVNTLHRRTFPTIDYDDFPWVTIPDAPRYEINKLGEVRNRRTGRILKTYYNQRGIECVQMRDAGYEITRSVPKLVWDLLGEIV